MANAELIPYDSKTEFAAIEEMLAQWFQRDRARIAMAVLRQLQPERAHVLRPILRPQDLSHQERPENEPAGHIAECRWAGCGTEKDPGWACCSVPPGAKNTIYLTSTDKAKSLDRSHLQFVGPASNGVGTLWACNNGCDGGTGCRPIEGQKPSLKPRDCGDYPWFININDAGHLEMYVADRDGKCSLSPLGKLVHLVNRWHHFHERAIRYPQQAEAARNAIDDMHGYTFFDPEPLEQLTGTELKRLLWKGVSVVTSRIQRDAQPGNRDRRILGVDDQLALQVVESFAHIPSEGIQYSTIPYAPPRILGGNGVPSPRGISA